MSDFQFSTEEYILYLLSKIEPDRCDLLKLNKVAFFTEFYFYFHNGKELSEASYAAIPKGPVIDQYKTILEKLQGDGKIKIDGYLIRPLTSPSLKVPEDISNKIDKTITKYATFTNDELISLSHLTDSYKITTDNEKVTTGNIIDKKLALLETFFDEGTNDVSNEVDDLLDFDRSELVPYGI